jgi:histidyl-tRNA synthetase
VTIDRPVARLPKGFRDSFSNVLTARHSMIERICSVYSLYGFQLLETSAVEYLDALGKNLPDTDMPDGGVFAFKDDDGQWLALRYDLTAPLARVFSENNDLPNPFRRYQFGPVWRREKKPGTDRFREFYQCDFDTVGTDSPVADAEVCAVLYQALLAVGIPKSDFIVRVNNRKLLNGVLDTIQIDDPAIRLLVLRSIDKLDKVGINGVVRLLGEGSEDASGQKIPGLGLADEKIEQLIQLLHCNHADRSAVCNHAEEMVKGSPAGLEGIQELRRIDALLESMGLGSDVIKFDTNVVRGLEYYTGPVFEAELTFMVKDGKKEKKFGSVAGGGRYDYLVERFTGKKVPATGASIGIDRLLAALMLRQTTPTDAAAGPVIVTVMDAAHIEDYQRMTSELRAAGIVSEMYLGTGNFKSQLKYADKRLSPVVIIAGSNEFANAQVTLKDMQAGKVLSEQISDNQVWRKEQPAQRLIARSSLVSEVRSILDRSATRTQPE